MMCKASSTSVLVSLFVKPRNKTRWRYVVMKVYDYMMDVHERCIVTTNRFVRMTHEANWGIDDAASYSMAGSKGGDYSGRPVQTWWVHDSTNDCFVIELSVFLSRFAVGVRSKECHSSVSCSASCLTDRIRARNWNFAYCKCLWSLTKWSALLKSVCQLRVQLVYNWFEGGICGA